MLLKRILHLPFLKMLNPPLNLPLLKMPKKPPLPFPKTQNRLLNLPLLQMPKKKKKKKLCMNR